MFTGESKGMWRNKSLLSFCGGISRQNIIYLDCCMSGYEWQRESSQNNSFVGTKCHIISFFIAKTLQCVGGMLDKVNTNLDNK